MSKDIFTSQGSWVLNQSTHKDIELLLLHDIRKELIALNLTLNCHRVPAMADAMIRVDERLKRNGLSLAKRNRK